MNRKDAVAWVLWVCAPCLAYSQAKTLSELVAGAIRCQRISLPNIGRAMTGTVRSQIKRCWRVYRQPTCGTGRGDVRGHAALAQASP